MKCRRWPLHPAPQPGESLASWMRRIGEGYGYSPMQIGALLTNEYRPHHAWEMSEPTKELLFGLSTATGVPVRRIQGRTFHEFVPYQLEIPDRYAGDAKRHYFARYSILLPKLQGPYDGFKVKLWLGGRNGHWPKVCRECLRQEPKYQRLIWNHPFAFSCPRHGQLLVSPRSRRKPALASTIPKRLPRVVRKLDRITSAGFINGEVNFNGRRMSIQLWLCLVRNLIREVATPHRATGSEGKLLDRIWKQVGRRPKNPFGQIFEHLPYAKQFRHMHAAARALDMIASGEIDPPGRHLHLLLPPAWQERR